MTCKNCGAQHGCGCQEKIASDGAYCCTSCIATYEASRNTNSVPPVQQPNHVGIKIESVTYTHNHTG